MFKRALSRSERVSLGSREPSQDPRGLSLYLKRPFLDLTVHSWASRPKGALSIFKRALSRFERTSLSLGLRRSSLVSRWCSRSEKAHICMPESVYLGPSVSLDSRAPYIPSDPSWTEQALDPRPAGGGGVWTPPPPLRFFEDSKKTAARSAAGFSPTLPPICSATFVKISTQSYERSGHQVRSCAGAPPRRGKWGGRGDGDQTAAKGGFSSEDNPYQKLKTQRI